MKIMKPIKFAYCTYTYNTFPIVCVRNTNDEFRTKGSSGEAINRLNR